MSARDDELLELAVSLAEQNVTEGGGPFGAVIAVGGDVIGRGQNRVTRDNDPTAHAEIQAIRDATSSLGTFSLAGATLYTSCEPCPMCLAASLWARIDRIVYAADRADAAAAGFDDSEFYELFGRDRATWSTEVVEHRIASADRPFEAWRANPARVDY